MNRTLNHSTFTSLDGFIKLLLAVTIAILPFYIENKVSYIIFLVYLMLFTLTSRISYRTLLLSGASYFIIVLIPYLFGILLNGVLYNLTRNEALIMQQGYAALYIRLFRLFIIWYVSILYFHTTHLETVLSLLDRLLFPLKLLKLPVQDFLKIIMCIVTQLKGTSEDMKTRFLEDSRYVMGGNAASLKSKFNGISRIIVSSLVNSFHKLDEVESMVEEMSLKPLFKYRFKMGKPEWLAVLSTALLILSLYIVEKGNGFLL